MLRKAGVVVMLAALLIWLVMWSGSWMMQRAAVGSAERVWPLGLGILREVPARFPRTEMSSAAARLIGLAIPLGIDLAPRRQTDAPAARPLQFVREQLTKWLDEQIASTTPEIAPLPSEAGEFLAGRGADLAAITTLLSSGEPIVWPQDIRDPGAPLPNLFGHVQLNRVLVARSLDRARVGDRGAWNDLFAAWSLARPLLQRPETIANLMGLASAKQLDAAARKLPLPVPLWLEEMHAFDFRQAFAAAQQVEAWRIVNDVFVDPETADPSVLRRVAGAIEAPYMRMSGADVAESWRRFTAEVVAVKACAADIEAMARRHGVAWWNVPGRQTATPNLDAMWRRVLRWTPQREATVRALALRQGAPPTRQSACADGEWTYSEEGKSFRFSRDVPEGSPAPIPLAFSVTEGGGSPPLGPPRC